MLRAQLAEARRHLDDAERLALEFRALLRADRVHAPRHRTAGAAPVAQVHRAAMPPEVDMDDKALEATGMTAQVLYMQVGMESADNQHLKYSAKNNHEILTHGLRQVEVRALVRSLPLDRALSAVLPVGNDNDPCSSILDMSDDAVDLAMARLSPIIGDLLKRRIKAHRDRQMLDSNSAATGEAKFSFSMVGGDMDDFMSGVTGRVGEPRDDMEKG